MGAADGKISNKEGQMTYRKIVGGAAFLGFLLAGLPAHILRDIGVVELRPDAPPAEGDALRKHLW